MAPRTTGRNPVYTACYRAWLCLPSILFLALSVPCGVQAQTMKEAMNLNALMQVASSSLSALEKSAPVDPGQILEWSGTYTDSGWTCSISGTLQGRQVALSYQGSLAGNIGQDILVSFIGAGNWGTDVLSADGQSAWHYNSGTSSYDTVDFEHLARVGEPTWVWNVASGTAGGGNTGGTWGAGWNWSGARSTDYSASILSSVASKVTSGWEPPPAAGARPCWPWPWPWPGPDPWPWPWPNPDPWPWPWPGPYPPFPYPTAISGITGASSIRMANGPAVVGAGTLANGTVSGAMATTPEPGSLMALGSGIVTMAGMALRRRR